MPKGLLCFKGGLAHWTGPFQHLWQVDNCWAAFWIHNNDSATFDRCPSSRNADGKHYHLGWLFREKVPQRLDICTQNHKLLETTADLAVWAHSAEVSRSFPLPPLDTGRSYQRDAFTSFSHTLPTLRWFLCSDPHAVRNTGQRNKVRAAFAHRKPRSEKIWSATGSQQSSNKGDNVPESDCSCVPKSDRKTPLSKYPTPLRLGRETIAMDLSPWGGCC